MVFDPAIEGKEFAPCQTMKMKKVHKASDPTE
jgi:hypothetical protein